MKRNKLINKTKEEHAGITVRKNPLGGFENYSSGLEIMNQIAAGDSTLSE